MRRIYPWSGLASRRVGRPPQLLPAGSPRLGASESLGGGGELPVRDPSLSGEGGGEPLWFYGGMNVLVTIGVAVVSAFVSTVVLQYVFAPLLEARKSRLLELRRVEAEFSDKLRELRAAEWHLRELPVGTGEYDLNLAAARDAGQSLVRDLNLHEYFGRMRLRPELEFEARRAWTRSSDLVTWWLPGDGGLDELTESFRLTAELIDPATAPWERRGKLRKLQRLDQEIQPVLSTMHRRKLGLSAD